MNYSRSRRRVANRTGGTPACIVELRVHLHGIGIDENRAEGTRLLGLSADQGFEPAARQLENLPPDPPVV